MFLSIIVPLYNVESYIESCLRSLISQDISDYEIIVVNDGSTDNSFLLASDIASKYDNIRIISQKNQGLSSARNTGLSISKGDYIWYVDSDDEIEPYCLCELKKFANDYDVIALGMVSKWPDRTENSFPLIYDSQGKIIWEMLQPAAPNYIYKREFLIKNKLFFKEGIFHEDFELTPKIIYLASKIGSYYKDLYIYYRREQTISTTINVKRPLDMIDNANALFRFAQENVKKSDFSSFLNIVGLGLNNALSYSLFLSYIDRKKVETSIRQTSLYKKIRICSNIKYKLESYIFMLSMGYFIVKFYKVLQLLKK